MALALLAAGGLGGDGDASALGSPSQLEKARSAPLTLKRDPTHPTDVYSWFEVTLQEIDVPGQMFTVSVEAHIFWQDFTFPLLNPNFEEEEFTLDEESVPVKLSEVFENKLTHDFEVDPKYKYLSETGTIYMMFVSNATFNERLELDNFPLDRQFLNMKFNAWVKKGNWNWIGEYVDWVPSDFHKQFAVRATSSITEYELLSPWVDFTGDQPLDIRLRVERKPEFYVGNIIVPNFLIVAGCFSVFTIDKNDVGDRLATNVTLMLAAVAFRFVVTSMLPKVSYLTYMDIYLLVGFVGVLIFITENAICGIDSIDPKIRSDIDYTFCAVAAGLWFITHFIMFYILFSKEAMRTPWHVMDELDKEEGDEFIYADAADVKGNNPSEYCKEQWLKYQQLSPTTRVKEFKKDNPLLNLPTLSASGLEQDKITVSDEPELENKKDI